MTVTESDGRDTTLDSGVHLSEVSGTDLDMPTPWAPIKVSRSEIEAIVEGLEDGPPPGNGRRATLLVHPESTRRGFAPGIDVTIEVLLPGEKTQRIRRNSTQVHISIGGGGSVSADGITFHLAEHDVCTIPSMKPYQFENDGAGTWVRLTYSNAPLLAQLGTHYFEPVGDGWTPTIPVDGPIDMDEPVEVGKGTAPDFIVSPQGARLRGYEFLVDIEPVPDRPLHWPFEAMSELMSQEPGDGGRTIMALYNPSTKRKQGATSSFFVTLSQIPPGHKPHAEGRGHRHSSVAINYHFKGSGYSIVDGQRIDWEPGDLLLSAPSWREHAHYPSETGVSAYTVQDHPLHIGMESLVWQENMEGPILALGTEAGQTGYVAPRNWDDEDH
jgi:gentisate 1,2-dioxygenase